MSDFAVSSVQRRRLLAGDYKPLEFKKKPYGCERGAVYVLAWKRASATAYKDGFVAHTPACPVWFLTVTKVTRWRKGMELVWTVKFEVTDRRDQDLWLSRSGNYQWTARGAVDVLPVAPSDEVRAKAIAERDHLARLQRHAEKMRERARFKRDRRAA